jgi:hypothetical protein
MKGKGKGSPPEVHSIAGHPRAQKKVNSPAIRSGYDLHNYCRTRRVEKRLTRIRFPAQAPVFDYRPPKSGIDDEIFSPPPCLAGHQRSLL